MTYKEAFDKMTIAYIKGEVNPFDNRFCFCGNLEDNTLHWKTKIIRTLWQYSGSFSETGIYSPIFNNGNPDLASNYSAFDYVRMEQAYMTPINLFFSLKKENDSCVAWIDEYNESSSFDQGYEDANYRGFVAALEMLADIHRRRGEDVDESLKLVKKQPLMA